MSSRATGSGPTAARKALETRRRQIIGMTLAGLPPETVSARLNVGLAVVQEVLRAAGMEERLRRNADERSNKLSEEKGLAEEPVRFVDEIEEPSTLEELLWASCSQYHLALLEHGELERVQHERGLDYREAYDLVRDEAYREWTEHRQEKRLGDEERALSELYDESL